MEAMLLSSTPDQTISPYKHIRNNPRKNTHAFISRPSSENFAPPSYILNLHGGGLIGPSPSLTSSLPSSVAFVNQRPTPPLLPLPVSKSYSSLPTRNSQGLSTSPTIRKTNSKTRGGLDVTPKRPKSSTSLRKQESRSEAKSENTGTVSTINPSGPDPSDLPKKVSRVLKPKVSFRSVTDAAADTTTTTAFNGGVEELACSIFSLAPPPSSLPLPKFSLKPKLGCNIEAAGGVDAGATDNLRRLLRLR